MDAESEMTNQNESADAPISFGKYLKAYRKARDLTQAELAKLVGYSLMSIRKIEADQQRPSKYLAERLAEKLALSPDEASVFICLARTLPAKPTLPTALTVSDKLPSQPINLIEREKEISKGTRLLPEVRWMTKIVTIAITVVMAVLALVAGFFFRARLSEEKAESMTQSSPMTLTQMDSSTTSIMATDQVDLQNKIQTQSVTGVKLTPSNFYQEEGLLFQNEIKELSNKWGEQIFRGTGWLHVITRYDNDHKGGSLPNGQLIPSKYTLEDWHQLDADNQVVITVNFMWDENGNLVQEGFFKDGIWHNLTINETFPGEAVPLSFDFGFQEEVRRSLAQGAQISRNETVTANNQNIITFTAHEPQAQPRAIAGYAKMAIAGEAHAAFDAQTGRILWAKHVLIMADGEQRVINRVEIVTLEHVSTPSQEVISLLEGVTK
jgi:transcriptional regulator with XRE-family HTH domain